MGFIIGTFLWLFCWAAVIVVRQIWCLVRYILEGRSKYLIASRRGFESPWLAWVPVANYWLLGGISDQYHHLTDGKNSNNRRKLLVVRIVEFAASAAGVLSVLIMFLIFEYYTGVETGDNDYVVGVLLLATSGALFRLAQWIARIIRMIFTYIACRDLYHSCKPKRAKLLLWLSVIFPVLLPFFIFSCRKYDEGMPVQTQI